MQQEELMAAMAMELPFEPTGQQATLAAALVRWCCQDPQDTSEARPAVFVLNGYAGTGKTSVVGALVRALKTMGVSSVLMASTGRAAKVLSAATGWPAQTIHRKIYRAPGPSASGEGGMAGRAFVPARNPHTDTLFVVDEASMIGGGGDEGLLADLVTYVYTGRGCRLLLVGDTAQLPPVGADVSPAMLAQPLRDMGLRVTRAEITQTVRQHRGSGILLNATLLRRALTAKPKAPEPPTAPEPSAPIAPSEKTEPSENSDKLPAPRLRLEGMEDVAAVDSSELQDALEDSYAAFGEEETIVIAGSNRRAVGYNRAIRLKIFDRTERLTEGERLIVAKNNYFWTTHQEEKSSQAERPSLPQFIANGEALRVEQIYGTETRGMMTFADVQLTADGYGPFDAKIIMDSLLSEDPSLSAEEERDLADLAFADAGLTDRSTNAQRIQALRQSRYYNALRVKYAYAVTCHKAQGGQWASVFVDPGGLDTHTRSFYRWLYTAITRASEQLTIVGLPEED